MTAPDDRCPKCGWARSPATHGEEAACPRCGLVPAFWSGRALPDARLDEAGERLWSEVQSAWRDDSRHEAFIRHCAAVGRLGAAGRRYRDHLDQSPGDPTALAMRQRILHMASQLMVARGGRPAAPPPVTRARWFAALIVGAMLAGLLAGLLYSRGP